MPRAYGKDRVETLDGGRFRIVSPAPKGWRAGKPATRTTAEFPGTAVAWDDEIWEVVSTEERTGANSRYVLAPWKDAHAIRLTVDYNSGSETALDVEHQRNAARSRMSAGLYVMGLVAGQLPAHVQQEIESEYGFVATRMSLLSLIPEIIVAALTVRGLPIEGLPGPVYPQWVLLLGGFFLFDVLVRSPYCLLLRKALGSLPGLVVWSLAMALSPRARQFDRKGTRRAESRLSASSVRPPSDFERERDIYAVREPFLALLPADDQARLATTFGFDPIMWGRRSALSIAILAGAGVASTILKILGGAGTGGTWLSLVIAALFFAEQLQRFGELRRGNPAGSVLGAIARPLCAVLLAMKPRGLEQGSTRRVETNLPAVWEGNEPEPPESENQTGR